MEEAKDIVRISVPFAAGAMLSALLFRPFPIAATALPITACLIVAGLRSRKAVLFIALFFLLGAFCHSSSAIAGSGGARIFGGALAALSARIDALPFTEEGTRALVRALLTGQRDLLDAGTVKVFRAAGASHILALSGLHLGIICLTAGGLLQILGRSRTGAAIRSAAVVAFAAFYTFMTGASPSTVRALLFITLGEAARHSPGRKKDPASIWCTAMLIQLTFAPGSVTSVGFQLSYLAMLGIFVLFPKLDAWYPRSGRFDPFRKIWSAVALSCSCQVFTAPLVWFTFHSFPQHFILTNLLALPLTEALILCAIAALVSTLLPEAGVTAVLASVTDRLASTLQWSLGIIAGM